MTALRESLSDYLALRRSVGYKLEDAARILASFVAFAEHAGADTITTELALSWAARPQQASPIWQSHRLSAVRGFARYLHALDPRPRSRPVTCSPPPAIGPSLPVFRHRHRRPAGGGAAADTAVAAATFGTLLGLLAVAGMRIGEAMRLNRDNVDWDEKVLLVRSSKFGRSREVVCHDSTIEALRAYSARRDQLCPRPVSARFFVSARGRRLAHHSVYAAFHQLTGEAGRPPQRTHPGRPQNILTRPGTTSSPGTGRTSRTGPLPRCS